ncbi:MAG: hypothetical protein PHC54_06855 [Candidatus Omnitrophica bacterium]|nr:hypothetical protein [Candidatus Omnitrophota bacterium]MDD5592944.1 hypothetical protein [Candidatus Omnitrophota bacterium]
MKESSKDNEILDKLNIEAAQGPAPAPKIAGFPAKLFGIIKFVMGACLLPFVYSFSLAFFNEFNVIERTFKGYFWAGIISFVIIYLFIYEPAIIYKKGQRLLEIIFKFFKPLVRVAPYLLPVYTIIVFILCLLLLPVFKEKEVFGYFIFLLSFSLALHLIFGAKSIRSKQGDFLKANYIFGFSFIYIIDLVLISFCLNILFKEFSFVNFFNNSCQIGSNIFYAIFKQFFFF